MKKFLWILIIVLLFLGIVFLYVVKNPSGTIQRIFTISDMKNFTIDNTIETGTSQKDIGNYLGSYCSGNFVWGAAMNLAWNELNENIIHEKLQLNTYNELALIMVAKFNTPVFTKNDLDESSYYIKSGYGQETVDAINTESREKFPNKSFDNLQIVLGPTDIISYAYFLKEVEYPNVFNTKDVLFSDQKISGFYAPNIEQKDNVKIVSYINDDKFIIILQLKDESDQLILAKGYDMNNPQIIIDRINMNNNANLPTLGNADIFEAPLLHLEYNRNYSELLNKKFVNKGRESYSISQMYENIKFDMNEKGARVENEAGVGGVGGMLGAQEKPRSFLLDKPYWVIMKRTASLNPYFILGINNTKLMIKK